MNLLAIGKKSGETSAQKTDLVVTKEVQKSNSVFLFIAVNYGVIF